MRLTKLRFFNFRCFADRELDLSPQFNLLIGENGTGKTAALDAMAVAIGSWFLGLSGVKTRHLLQSDVRKQTFMLGDEPDLQRQYPCWVEAWGDVLGKDLYWCRELQGEGGKTTLREASDIKSLSKQTGQRVRKGEEVTLPLISYYGTGRLWQLPRQRKPKKGVEPKPKTRLEGYKLSVDPRCSPKDLIAWLVREEFIAFQKKQERPTYQLVRDAISSCLEGPSPKIWFDAEHQDVLVTFDGSQFLPFNSLSDGQRNVLALVGDIAVKAATLNPHLGYKVLTDTPGVVLIDELDLHLHPKWQRRIIDDLKRVFPKIQFIATTHSPFLIQALKPGELVNLQPPKEGSVQSEYADKSVEDITENVMGVEMPQKSERYQQMVASAEAYFAMLRDPDRDPEQLAELERQLDDKTLPFSDDPAFQALLRLERLSSEGEQ